VRGCEVSRRWHKLHFLLEHRIEEGVLDELSAGVCAGFQLLGQGLQRGIIGLTVAGVVD
jgi:hypothetical protein